MLRRGCFQPYGSDHHQQHEEHLPKIDGLTEEDGIARPRSHQRHSHPHCKCRGGWNMPHRHGEEHHIANAETNVSDKRCKGQNMLAGREEMHPVDAQQFVFAEKLDAVDPTDLQAGRNEKE